MSQPRSVPNTTPVAEEYYESPPSRPRAWWANRPGDIDGFQPEGAGLGSQGPDQGFAYKLVDAIADDLHLASGEHFADVKAGLVSIGLKRASQFMRAPARPDIDAAVALFDFANASPDADFARLRASLFAGISHPHHYDERRALADKVPADLLRRPVTDIRDKAANFRFDLLSSS